MSKWKAKLAGRKHRDKAKGGKEEGKNVEKKRTHFFPGLEKKEKKNAHLPPKDAQAFSANWKNLVGLLNSKPTAETEKSAQQKEGPTPQSAANKDFHRAAQKTDKSVNKSGHKPPKTTNKASHGVKTKSPEDAGAQQNGKGPSGPRQHKAEKRKAKDSGDGDGDKKWRSKKQKAEETEEEPIEPDIWFDDVDSEDIEAALGSKVADFVRKKNSMTKSAEESTEQELVKDHSYDGVTQTVAMDCEMVGVGPDGKDSMVARVSIVNRYGKCIYDKYVKPTEKVTDYRTAFSGIRPADIANGENICTVQKEVAEILKGRLLVGHAIHNDLKILLLDHPKKMIRDTQKYKEFKKIAKSPRPALRVLSKKVLNVNVQQGEHSSVQDAQATMRLYTMVRKRWEAEVKAQKTSRKPKADLRAAPTQHTVSEETQSWLTSEQLGHQRRTKRTRR